MYDLYIFIIEVLSDCCLIRIAFNLTERRDCDNIFLAIRIKIIAFCCGKENLENLTRGEVSDE